MTCGQVMYGVGPLDAELDANSAEVADATDANECHVSCYTQLRDDMVWSTYFVSSGECRCYADVVELVSNPAITVPVSLTPQEGMDSFIFCPVSGG